MTAALALVRDHLDGALPPHDTDAEQAVISAVLLLEAALPRIVDFLHAEHFYSGAHARIYEAAVAVRAAGSQVDVVTVGSRLREEGRLNQVGGMPYLTEILSASPVLDHVRDHAITVFERWRARRVIAVCQHLAAIGYDSVTDVQGFADRGVTLLAEIARQAPGVKVESNIETLKRVVRQMSTAGDGKADKRITGIPTQIRSYDRLTLGLHAGTKTTLVALPRVGKTALALQLAMTVATQGIGVIFFSTEMTRDELAVRQLAHLSAVDSLRIKAAMQKPTLTEIEWSRLSAGLARLDGIKYRIDVHDEASVTVEEIATCVKARVDQGALIDGVPLGLVIVDYVQRLRPSKCVATRNTHDQVWHSTVALKNLAKQCKLPVLELAQQKIPETDRKTGKRHRPKLGDAAACGYIERESDDVFYLHRDDERDGRNLACIGVKVRSGPEGEFPLTFHQEYSRFTEPGDDITSPSRQYVDQSNRYGDDT